MDETLLHYRPYVDTKNAPCRSKEYTPLLTLVLPRGQVSHYETRVRSITTDLQLVTHFSSA